MLERWSKPRNGYFLRAESFFNIAAFVDSDGTFAPDLSLYGDAPLHQQSHGESFLALATNRFAGEGLYILDEPEAALSVTGALAVLAAIDRAAKGGAQFIIATHSPILLACPGARIYELDEDGFRECRRTTTSTSCASPAASSPTPSATSGPRSAEPLDRVGGACRAAVRAHLLAQLARPRRTLSAAPTASRTPSSPSCTPAPIASSWAALANWSTACGIATVGTPNHSDSLAPPMPAWVMKTSACASTSSCGWVRAASTPG